jgi:hypothetical protein
LPTAAPASPAATPSAQSQRTAAFVQRVRELGWICARNQHGHARRVRRYGQIHRRLATLDSRPGAHRTGQASSHRRGSGWLRGLQPNFPSSPRIRAVASRSIAICVPVRDETPLSL